MLDKTKISDTLNIVRELSKKRKFDQSVDLVLNLIDINPKKQEDAVDIFVILPIHRKKTVRICALIDKNLIEKAKIFDRVIIKEDLQKLAKKEIKEISKLYNFFVAQITMMPAVASAFGKILGPLGKMPSPKIGCVITPESDLEDLKRRLQKIIRIRTRNEPIIKASVGVESMKDEELIENISAIYSGLIGALPQEERNIKNIGLKLTMGPLVKIGSKKEDVIKELDQKNLKKKKMKDTGLEKKKSEKETKKPKKDKTSGKKEETKK